MAYNADLIMAQRAKTDEKARKMFRAGGGGQQLPFVKDKEFRDGTYSIRMWPSDDTKNPFGYLTWRTHVYELRSEKERLEVLCPRTSNWDPMPCEWQDPETGESCDAGKGIPIFKTRCYACELLEQIQDMDIMDRFSASLKRVFNGEYVGYNLVPGMWGVKTLFVPATVKMEIALKEERKTQDGLRTYTITEYQPSTTGLFHCILSFDGEKPYIKTMEDQILVCPDLNAPVTGRWLHLKKNSGEKGAGRYTWMMDPNPSSLGFEIPKNLYPNFATWGTGSGQKPSKRKDYREIEAYAGNPQSGQPPVFWWAEQLREMGVLLTDAEADPAPF